MFTERVRHLGMAGRRYSLVLHTASLLLVLVVASCLAETEESSPADERVGEASAAVEVWTNVPPAVSPHAPTAVRFGTYVYLFWVANDGEIHRSRSNNGGSTWSAAVGMGKTTNMSPTAVVFNDTLYLYAIDTSNRITVATSSDGTIWSSFAITGGFTWETDLPIAATVHDGDLYLVAKKSDDDRLYWRRNNGSSWTSWQQYSSTYTAEVAPAIASHDGAFFLFTKHGGTVRRAQGLPGGPILWTNTGHQAQAISAFTYETSGPTDPGIDDPGDLYLYITRPDDKIDIIVRGRNSFWFQPAIMWGDGFLTTKAIGYARHGSRLWNFRRLSNGQIRVKTTQLNVFPFNGSTAPTSLNTWTCVGNDDEPGSHHAGEQQYSFDFLNINQSFNYNVRAVAAGTVEQVHYKSSNCRWDGEGSCRECGDYASPCSCGYGNGIAIRHADGTVSTYAHLKYETPVVEVGEEVSAGEVIGHMDQTGSASGIHVHVALCSPEWEVNMDTNIQCNVSPCVPLPMYFTDDDTADWRPHAGEEMNQP